MIQPPSNEQLALFSKRLRRAMNSENSRHLFGVAFGEYDFRFHPDVVRTVEWIEGLVIEGLVNAEAEQPSRPADLRKITSRSGKTPS
jgi:hypothetical protein